VLTRICAIYVAVCEEVCGKPNLFDDQLYIMANIKSMDDVRELVKKQEEVTRLEDRVKAWMKKVQEVCYFILKPSAFSHSFAYCIHLVLTLFMICLYIFPSSFGNFGLELVGVCESKCELYVFHHLSSVKNS
jgi:hypothetical protein